MNKKIKLKTWLQSTGITLGLLMLLMPTLAQSTNESQLRSTVYVNASATGIEDGSSSLPFNTILEGVNAVDANGVVLIQTGTYREALIIQRPMELRSTGGVVTIQPGATTTTPHIYLPIVVR